MDNSEEEKRLYLTYDSLHNPFVPSDDNEVTKPWVYMTLPFRGLCCLKILNITVKYKESLPEPGKISGYLTINTSKRFQSKINDRGRIINYKNYLPSKTNCHIHIPLSYPGTENPKAIHGASLDLRDNENEVKFCISDENLVPIELHRIVIVMEFIPRLKQN